MKVGDFSTAAFLSLFASSVPNDFVRAQQQMQLDSWKFYPYARRNPKAKIAQKRFRESGRK